MLTGEIVFVEDESASSRARHAKVPCECSGQGRHGLQLHLFNLRIVSLQVIA